MAGDVSQETAGIPPGEIMLLGDRASQGTTNHLRGEQSDCDDDSRPTSEHGELVDIVDTWEQAAELSAPPLVIREGLRTLLGSHQLPAVARIGEGHSNATFLVETDSLRCILRRPPRPPFEPKAHDVLREYRFLAVLRDEPVRVPPAILECDDSAVIGAPFYLMEALDGVALRDQVPPGLDRPEERRLIGQELVDTLAELHRIDPAHPALGGAGSASGYLQRQLDLWQGQWERNQTRRVETLENVAQRLRRDMPRTQRGSIVHGDYKLDNVLFAWRTPVRLLAVLDWEMATVGDPLADLGYLTATWVDPDEDPGRINGLSSVTAQAGFPTRRELAQRYAEQTGLDLGALAWYQGLALWKLAIILEASYRRFLTGTASDPFFETLAAGVPKIAEQALGAIDGELLD